MPVLILVVVACALMLFSVRGDPEAFGALVARDFTGNKGFATFAGAFVVIGAIGFVPQLKPVSRIFLVLMVVALVLAFYRGGGNLVHNLSQQWGVITSRPTPTPVTSNTQGTK